MSPSISGFPFTQVTAESAGFEVFVDVMNRALVEEWGELAQQTSLEDYRAEDQVSGRNQYFIVWVGERPVAVAKLDATDTGRPQESLGIVRVLRAVEGYGIGQGLIRHLEDVARGLGLTTITGITSARTARDDRTTRILHRAGYTDLSLLLRQDLALPGAEAPREVPGFRIEATATAPRSSFLRDLAQMMNEFELDDEDGIDEEIWDEERLTSITEVIGGTGRTLAFAIAYDESDGHPVGYSEAAYRTGDPMAEQNGTYVNGRYRRRGIATALRVQLLEALLAEAPGVPRIRTFSRSDNAEVIGVNHRLGYSDTAVYRFWEKSLA